MRFEWIEDKDALKKGYEKALDDAANEDGVVAIVLTRDHRVESFSVSEYMKMAGYTDEESTGTEGEVVVHAHEGAQGNFGRPYWLIALVGGGFEAEDNAFEETWQNKLYYYESQAATSAQ